MVLVSHKHKLIYLKTGKTAGTSVEILFELLCGLSEAPSHQTDEIVSESGIIGARGNNASQKTWHNHMPAHLVKEKLGDSIWNDYFKCCIVRNPWDKMVSLYYWRKKNGQLSGFQDWLMRYYSKFVPKHNWQDWLASFPDRRSLKDWMAKSPINYKTGNIIDRKVYTINNQLALDFYIRFENLQEGIVEVCDKLGLVCDSQYLGNYKGGIRKNKAHYTEYYNQETQGIVQEMFNLEIKEFNYQFGD